MSEPLVRVRKQTPSSSGHGNGSVTEQRARTCWEAKLGGAQGGDHDVLLDAQVLGHIHQLDCRLPIDPGGCPKVKEFGFCSADSLNHLRGSA